MIITMRTAILIAAAITLASALEASVWMFDNPRTNPTISPENARLVLAHRLGLSRYHKLAQADEQTLALLNTAQEPLFSQRSSTKKLMIIVEGVEEDLIDLKPSFMISNPPSAESNKKLVQDLLVQDMHSKGGSRHGNHEPAPGSIQGGSSTENPIGLCLLSNQEHYTRMSAIKQLEILYSESTVLCTSQETCPPTLDTTSIYHINTLSDAITKHGSKSREYKTLWAELRNVLDMAKSSDRFNQMTVVGMPAQSRTIKRESYGTYDMPLIARQEQPLTESVYSVAAAAPPQITKAANRTLPRTTISVCWSSESACKANTADCSGHGACLKKYSEKVSQDETGAECWACSCTPTVLDNADGQKTIYWGGPACQKKDISVPFFLFAGFTIAALAALSYGVGLLYSIGEEDLPSVLGAGVAPPSNRK